MPPCLDVGAPVLLAQEEVRSTPPGGRNWKIEGRFQIDTKNTVFGHFDMSNSFLIISNRYFQIL